MSRTATATVPNGEWARFTKNMRKRIAKARRAAGVTHREVAEATYKSLRTSMRWCSGDLSPDLRVLIVLSRLFGCKVSDLTGVP